MFHFRKTIAGVTLVALLSQASPASAQRTSDSLATKQTKALLQNLFSHLGKGILLGHQDALAYGTTWKYQTGRSDIKDVTGDYPAVYGWELGHIEHGAAVNLDTVPFDKMRRYIEEGYERGGVITISWHSDNPLSGKSAWDVTPGAVTSVLPGGANHQKYIQYLSKVADFLASLKGKNGEAIPVLFRPYHEQSGNWFWWCQNVCTPDEYKALWRMTVTYLRDERQLHNLLYVYNTSEFKDGSSLVFSDRYPGDDIVDVVSLDSYDGGDSHTNKYFEQKADSGLAYVDSFALAHNKLPAFAEVGYEGIRNADWWLTNLKKVIAGKRISYMLFWRNAGYIGNATKLSYFTPYKGEKSVPQFRRFIKENHIILNKQAQKWKLYQEPQTNKHR